MIALLDCDDNNFKNNHQMTCHLPPDIVFAKRQTPRCLHQWQCQSLPKHAP